MNNADCKDIDRKETGLSDVERLGECSMPVKVYWNNIDRSKTVMVCLSKFYRVNIALNLIILIIDQFLSISFIKDSLQLVGQNFKPKTAHHGISRNWGFPKGNNSYLIWGWNLKFHGNGVFVVWGNSKGRQFINTLRIMSGIRRYTTKVQKSSRLEIRQVIEPKYSQLFDINIYKEAYERIKSTTGNMTKATDDVTLDDFSGKWAYEVIEKFKNRSFQFKPSSRVFFFKSQGKFRNLALTSTRDKIIQQAVRMIFESVFEPKFLNCSHGFRPNKSTITAVYEVRKWNGITWMIEGDIKGYFDNIDHQILANLLKSEIKDQNLLDLYWKLVKAGYVNDGTFKSSNLGVPQGGIISPLLSNIYLHEFDKFMMKIIDKYSDFSTWVSKPRPVNKAIFKSLNAEEKKKVSTVIKDEITETRVYYNRYADEWVIGVSGNKELAIKIKDEIKTFLFEKLSITLSEEKTKIIHVNSENVNYLGFQINRRSRRYTDSQLSTRDSGKFRATNASVIIQAPIDKLTSKLVDHGFAILGKNSKPKPKAVTKWIYLKPEEIIMKYNAIIRGILNYYASVDNRNQFSYLLWILKFSAVFTLARKLRISPRQVWKRFKNPITIKFNVSGKPKSISLFEPSTLKRNRIFKLRNYYNFDPFKVKNFWS